MPENQEDIFEEKISLQPKEKVELLMMDSFTQSQFDEFRNIELKPENIREFFVRIQQAIADNILTCNEYQTEKLDSFNIHPDSGKYFKFMFEQKEENKKTEKIDHQKWYGLTRLDWMDEFTRLMKLESKLHPRNALIINILVEALQKTANYIFSPKPSMIRQGVPSFGIGRSEKAYNMAKTGATSTEIAETIGKPVTAVRAYIIRGAEKAKDDVFLEELKKA